MTLTIQDVIDLLLVEIPQAPWADSVDTIKAGSAQNPLKGIVTTFMATRAVILQAQSLGANFTIFGCV
jgi:hypothetical protein